MRRSVQAAAILALSLAVLAGCTGRSAPPVHHEAPATVEHPVGYEVARIRLTQRAAERLGIETTQVGRAAGQGGATLRIPFSAVFYDAGGRTWAYTSPDPLTFVRHELDVAAIADDVAYLVAGPGEGTLVVTVGVAELYGTEFEVGH